MSRSRTFLLAALAATTFVCGSASAATIGGVAPANTGTSCADSLLSTSQCTFVQQTTHAGAPSYVIPFDGVATSFTVQLGAAVLPGDKLRFYTFEKGSGAAHFTASADSGPIALPGSSALQVVTLPVRQTVVAGQLLGLGMQLSTNTTKGFFLPAGATGADKLQGFNGYPTLGQDVTSSLDAQGYQLNMRAVVEPDADHDGYGDETQDICPTDKSDHGLCTAPVISDFKFSLNKFAVEKKGPVLTPAAAAQGTTVILTLSKPAQVQFDMKLRTTGRLVGKSCKKSTSKNRKKKKCTRYPVAYSFTRDLPAGTSNLGFSGRIRFHGKTKALVPGKWIATARPFSLAANMTGPTATTTFRVVAPPKRR
jgi:hypothetical protein